MMHYPRGGAFIVIENIIDDERKINAFGLIMSLNMLIETSEGYDFTFAGFDHWTRQAGFTKTQILPLTDTTSAAIPIK